MAAYYSYQLNYETFQATVIHFIGKSKISYYYFSKQGSVLILSAFPHLQLMVHPTQAWYMPVTGIFWLNNTALLNSSSQYSFRLHIPWKIYGRKWRAGVPTTSDEWRTQGHGPFCLGGVMTEQNPHCLHPRLQGLLGIDTRVRHHAAWTVSFKEPADIPSLAAF